MKVYLDTNSIIYFLENHPTWFSKVVAGIAKIRAAGDGLAVGDLARAECLVAPFKSGDAGLEARYRELFCDPDVAVLPMRPPSANERPVFVRIIRSKCPMPFTWRQPSNMAAACF